MAENKGGKVIPFAQNATFYLKRGAREAEKNDLLAALHRYRLACAAAPDEEEPTLALAQTLSYMQRFEESNRLLLQLLSRGDVSPECHYGLACNYFGMREYDYAAESLENYLDLEPDGLYAAEAEDFLDLLDDEDAMFEIAGLREDADYDANAACVYAHHLMDAGDYQAAVAVLQQELTHEPDSLPLKNLLSLAYLCCGESIKAATITAKLMDGGNADTTTRCNYALLLLTHGERDEAIEVIDALLKLRTESPEALNSIALLLMEAGRLSDAAEVLEQLLRLMPYQESVLHMLGYCRYHIGEYEAAQNCYKKLLRIDPADTVAKYYLKQSKKTDADDRYKRAHWTVPYQVPYAEAFRRLSQMNRYLLLPEDEQRTLWSGDTHYTELLKWALTMPDSRVKKSVLSVLYLYHDERAEKLMRDFLLRTDQPDDLKRAVCAMLREMGAKEPYMAYIDGRWLRGRINMHPFPYKLPAAYETVLRLLYQALPGALDENCLAAALAIFRRYADRQHPDFPRLSTQQIVSFAAALDFLGCKNCDVDVDEEEFCARYRISATRLRNAIVKLTPFVQEGEETT